MKKIAFNSNCKSFFVDGSSIKSVDLQSLKKLEDFSYYNGPLEELDISTIQTLSTLQLQIAIVKSLDVSKNPKLKK